MTESIDYYMAQYAIDTSESKLTLADLIVARRLLDGFLRKVRRADIDEAAAELAALKEQATRYQIVIGAIRVVPPSISKEDAAAAGRLARAVIDASETHHPQCNTILGTEWYCDCATLRMLNVPDDAIVKRTEPEAVSSPQNQAEPLVPYDVSVPCDRCGALAGAPCTVVEGMGNLMQDALRPGDVLPSTPHFYGGRRQPPLVADPSYYTTPGPDRNATAEPEYEVGQPYIDAEYADPNTINVGDRVSLAGVEGEVIAQWTLGFRVRFADRWEFDFNVEDALAAAILRHPADEEPK